MDTRERPFPRFPTSTSWSEANHRRGGGCGGDLNTAHVVGTARTRVFDFPPIALHVVEHRMNLPDRHPCPLPPQGPAPGEN